MSNIVEFKPRENSDNKQKTTKTGNSVVRFPNLTEYINLFERKLNGNRQISGIMSALLVVDKAIEKILDNDDKFVEMSDAIVNFAEYFQKKYGNFTKLWEVMNKQNYTPLCFNVASFIEEQKVLDEGLSRFFDLSENVQDAVTNLSYFIFDTLKGETLVSFIPEEESESNHMLQVFPRHMEEYIEDKRTLFIATIAQMIETSGCIFVEEKKKNRKTDFYGFICNYMGVFSIMPEELDAELPPQKGRTFKVFDVNM